MFAVKRLISTILQTCPRVVTNATFFPRLLQPQQFSTILIPKTTSLLNNAEITKISSNITRSVIKFSRRKGKRQTEKDVVKRFYRLNWGGWIRTIAGRHKHLWKKNYKRKWRIQRHILCNAQQSFLLDKMVTAYWRRPKHYVDDIYQPYHHREGFRFTYTKPKPYFPPEEK